MEVWIDTWEVDARYECPIGSLCYELAKGQGPLSAEAAAPFKTLLAWSEKQFRLLGETRQQASAHALHLVAALQGISLIANAMGNPDTILMKAKFLNGWLRVI